MVLLNHFLSRFSLYLICSFVFYRQIRGLQLLQRNLRVSLKTRKRNTKSTKIETKRRIKSTRSTSIVIKIEVKIKTRRRKRIKVGIMIPPVITRRNTMKRLETYPL